MGWLFMRNLEGHVTPKAYLDDQFTFARAEVQCRVLASAMVGTRTYYAAVEQVMSATGAPEVCGVVCLVRYNRRDLEGYIFGYKEMSEHAGPCEATCPTKVLDLLSPTDNANALGWRARCRANIAQRRARQSKPVPRPGQIVVLAQPLLFRDGATLARFEAVRRPGRTRGLVYRSAEGVLYAIPHLKVCDYIIEPGPLVGE